MRGGWLVGVVLSLGCGGKDADGGGGAAGAGASGTGAIGGTGGLGGTDMSGGGGAAPSGGASASGGGPSAGVGPSTGGNANPPSDPRTCADAPPDWVFCSDFEEGNKDVWDDYDGNPDETNLLMADGGPFDLADNHVMRLRAPAGRGGADRVQFPDS